MVCCLSNVLAFERVTVWTPFLFCALVAVRCSVVSIPSVSRMSNKPLMYCRIPEADKARTHGLRVVHMCSAWVCVRACMSTCFVRSGVSTCVCAYMRWDRRVCCVWCVACSEALVDVFSDAAHENSNTPEK